MSMKDTSPAGVKKTCLRHAEDVHWQKMGKDARHWRLERRSVVRTDECFVEKKAQAQLDDGTCSSSKVVGHH